MNDYDKYIFDELIKDYASMDINDVHQGELYQRFLNLEYLDEVKPYLITMQYLGIGTQKNRKVLKELKNMIGKKDYILAGLYFDLMLFEKEGNEKILERLKLMEEKGYTDQYLKERSHLHIESEEKPVSIIEEEEEEIEVTSMSFYTYAPEPDNTYYYGYQFTVYDTTYMYAKVNIKPLKKERKINVHSQITYVSEGKINTVASYDDEIIIKPGDTSFSTDGWGKDEGGFYRRLEHTWTITYDGGKTYSKKFDFLGYCLQTKPLPVIRTGLFAAGIKGNDYKGEYKNIFDVSTLEFIHLRIFIKLNAEIHECYQVFRKLVYLDDQTVLQDNYAVFRLNPGVTYISLIWGYRQPGKWKKGLYSYSFHFKNGEEHEVLFTVV